jgi:tetratricopeptide (TPR) repeat protein
MRIRNIIVLSWILLLTTFGGVAKADGKADRAKAKKLFEDGQVHYTVGRFHEALEDYSKAYELAHLPGFLFNIGQCHRELKEYDRALFFYEGYLREKPEAKNRAMVEDLIAEAKRKIAEQEEKKRRESQMAVNGVATGSRNRKPIGASALSPDVKNGVFSNADGEGTGATSNILHVSESPKAQEATPLYEKWWFWTIVGGAVAIAAGGTIYAISSGGNERMPAGSIGTVDFR